MIFLHRYDLRIQDNIGLKSLEGKTMTPIYIFNKHHWESRLISDQRKAFILDCLEDLNQRYEKRGGRMSFFYGDPKTILDSFNTRIVFNKDANHHYQDLETYLRTHHTGINSEAIQYDGRQHNWSRHAKKWFSTTIKTPKSFDIKPIQGNTSLSEMREEIDVKKESFGKGSRREARKRLKTFKTRISKYMKHISSPAKAEKITSHLSPYIRYGVISIREVYQEIGNGFNENAFKSRLVWQQHFRQKREDNPTLFKEAINPVYKDLHIDKKDEEKIRRWKDGQTGYPLVDATMRALKQTGWMNFRMRAMAASFYSYILKQWWKTGADHYFKHLIDADVAINYYQWQMQSGLVGVHANRIYNPTKQVHENDPDGEYIKKYVPELNDVPKEHIAEPWKLSQEQQKKYGIEIGTDYPEPIVNYEREARKARAYFKRKAPEAYQAFEDDEVWNRASLSDRHSRKSLIEKDEGKQHSLEEFT